MGSLGSGVMLCRSCMLTSSHTFVPILRMHQHAELQCQFTLWGSAPSEKMGCLALHFAVGCLGFHIYLRARQRARRSHGSLNHTDRCGQAMCFATFSPFCGLSQGRQEKGVCVCVCTHV